MILIPFAVVLLVTLVVPVAAGIAFLTQRQRYRGFVVRRECTGRVLELRSPLHLVDTRYRDSERFLPFVPGARQVPHVHQVT